MIWVDQLQRQSVALTALSTANIVSSKSIAHGMSTLAKAMFSYLGRHLNGERH